MAVTARHLRVLFDWPLAFSALGLIAFGVIGISSATGEHAASSVRGLVYIQLAWVALSLVGAIVAMWLPIRFWYGLAYLFYVAGVVALVATLAVGTHSRGAARWLAIGPIRLQTSEMAKIGLMLALARFLSNKKVSIGRPWDFMRGLGLALVPVALVEAQPDLGTAMVYVAITLPMIYWAGLNNLYLVLLVSPVVNALCAFGGWVPWLMFCLLFVGLLILVRPSIPWLVVLVAVNLAVGIGTPRIYEGLHPFQQQRIETFFSPEKDPLGTGYQIIQSKVAIGSGGAWGKGLHEGSQTKLSFLPETHTDFIFAVLGEELGFLGALIVLGLFLLLFWRVIRIALMVGNQFASFVCVGVGCMIAFHAIVNIGMTIGLMPVTGIPLALVSYGGSALITNTFALGLVLGFGLRRHE